MFGVGEIYDVLIIIGFLALQYFLSTRNNIYWGLLLPVVFLVWQGSLIFTSDQNAWVHILIAIVGLVFLLGEFSAGRNQVKVRRKKELEKISSHDLN